MTAFSTLYILQLVKSLAFHIPRIGHHREYHPPPPPPRVSRTRLLLRRKVKVYAWIVEHLTVRVVALFGKTVMTNDLITPKSHQLIFPHVGKSGIRIGKLLLVESGIRNRRKFCLWNLESWALESGIQVKESGIPLKIGIQNPSSTDKDWNPVPGIRNSRRGI